MIIKKQFTFLFLAILISLPYVVAEEVTIDNSTSIQNTIININDNGIINLKDGTYKESGIEISKDIILQGKSAPEKIMIDAKKKDSVIKVKNNVKLTIKNITFINAFNIGNGGAVSFYSSGELIIENCIFTNNNVKLITSGEALGGAIYVQGESKNYVDLKVTNSKFLNNSADTDGGAINMKFGNIIIKNCLFNNNSANRDGGSVSTRGLSDVYIEDSKFINNYANEWGGAINNWLAEYKINNCEFVNNKAEHEGGAISNCGSLTQITNSKFINNSATEEGGAIHSHYDAFNITVIAINNEFINNSAENGSTIYLRPLTTGTFNFENNYWGDNNPTWTKEFISNNVCDYPTSWLQTVNTTIFANDTLRGYNSPYDFSAVFLDKLGKPLKNVKVVFKLNDIEYNTVTNLNGVAELVLKLPVGNYKVISVNPLDGHELSKILTIVKRISGNNNLNKDYLSGTYKIRIIGDDGNNVKFGEKVIIKIGKSTYNIKTDKNGYASLKITKQPGKYNIFATYKGYTVKNKLVVKHILNAHNLSKKKTKITKYSAKLTGKSIKNKRIIFKINGKIYSSKTNSKGKATVVFNNLKKGKYSVTVKYVKDTVKKIIKIK